ncbi:type IV pilin [Methanosarcina sp. Mfa9]|uniref:type IV pilin n=1 Tax=Methanosarcina sp. Mfa9 TaxID=3439063 RepID=UPI003F837EBB
MNAAGIFSDKKAISPVVGVVMVTLVTIILVAVLGTGSLTGVLQGYSTNLGIGRIDGGSLEGDTITISHSGGEPFPFKENTEVLLKVEGETLNLIFLICTESPSTRVRL